MRIMQVALSAGLALGLGTGAAAQQSLGEVARELRKDKKEPAKVYTNDNLPSGTPISVTGTLAPAEKKTEGEAAAEPVPAEERKKAEADWRGKIAGQKKEVTQLERELDVMQRENKLRVAIFYSDAGNRLRDEKKYAEDDRKYQADLASKQQALGAARGKLDDLREQARKAGMPASVGE